jgi:guanylate kinase
MYPVLGNLKEGIIFIISAPAGTGKTTLVRKLCEEFPCVVENVSYTTRTRRKGEVEGRDYFYVTEEEFKSKIATDEFLEHAQVFGHYYGTSKYTVEELRRSGKHVVLVIDTQGAQQLQAKLDAVYIFIRPPDLNELKRRLINRKSESTEAAAHRLSWAERELALASTYDYQVINDNLETAYQVLRAILIAEEHRSIHK